MTLIFAFFFLKKICLRAYLYYVTDFSPLLDTIPPPPHRDLDNLTFSCILIQLYIERIYTFM